MESARQLILALDVPTAAAANEIAAAVGDLAGTYKVGMQLYTAAGPAVVRGLIESGHGVFLDLKYHDIPNTVGSAVAEAAALGVSMLTVHASGGAKMLGAAVGAASSNPELKVLAVTVLTSMNEDELHDVGVQGGLVDQVLRLAETAIKAGCHGVVASAREVAALRRELGQDFLIVTPGVRPAGALHGDQARVVTPAEAIRAGASQIVVGRPITEARDRRAAAKAILDELSSTAQLVSSARI